MSAIRPPAKWHGGKAYLAGRIIALMPEEFKRRSGVGNERVFVESYGGMGSVILNKPPCDVEVFNDTNLSVWNLFNSLKASPDEFLRLVSLTPYHQEEFRIARENSSGCGIEAAVSFYTRLRQSFGGQGKSFSYTKHRTRKGMADVVSGFLSSIEENLPRIISRLTEIQHVRNEDAAAVIRTFDSPTTLHYIDCPYLHETRATTDAYAFEMSYDEHDALLNVLLACKGKVMLSGYRSELYDQALHPPKWTRHDFDIANHAAGGDSKRRMTECLWVNW